MARIDERHVGPSAREQIETIGGSIPATVRAARRSGLKAHISGLTGRRRSNGSGLPPGDVVDLLEELCGAAERGELSIVESTHLRLVAARLAEGCGPGVPGQRSRAVRDRLRQVAELATSRPTDPTDGATESEVRALRVGLLRHTDPLLTRGDRLSAVTSMHREVIASDLTGRIPSAQITSSLAWVLVLAPLLLVLSVWHPFVGAGAALGTVAVASWSAARRIRSARDTWETLRSRLDRTTARLAGTIEMRRTGAIAAEPFALIVDVLRGLADAVESTPTAMEEVARLDHYGKPIQSGRALMEVRRVLGVLLNAADNVTSGVAPTVVGRSPLEVDVIGLATNGVNRTSHWILHDRSWVPVGSVAAHEGNGMTLRVRWENRTYEVYDLAERRIMVVGAPGPDGRTVLLDVANGGRVREVGRIDPGIPDPPPTADVSLPEHVSPSVVRAASIDAPDEAGRAMALARWLVAPGGPQPWLHHD